MPAARASAHSAKQASGSTTSWTQRGTTTGGRDAVGVAAAWSADGRSGVADAGRLGRPGRPSGSAPASPCRRGCRRLAGGRRLGRLGSPQTACNWKYEHPQDMSESVGILFVGDVVGGIGKRTLLALLPTLRERYAPDFVVVNGENVAGGVGITPEIARELFAAGVDVITLGNHTYRHREIYPYLDEEERILRPANFLASQPGHGWCVVAARRRPARRHLAVRQPVHEGRATGVRRRSTRRSTRLQGTRRPRARRHARRGHQREGRRWAGISTVA